MHGFEQLLGLFVAAVILAAAARRVGAPYPVFLAVGGALLAFLPIGSPLTLPPELVLALFVAPVLLDAAYDASLRDLKDNWAPVTGLVIFAVGFTTVAVALVVRALVPGMPWAPAIALGAVVAPPDAVAATAVLRQLRPPHRILTILEGESLLNDASALLIYRLAVTWCSPSRRSISMAIVASPEAGAGYMNLWARTLTPKDIDLLVDTVGLVPGALVGFSFLMMNPVSNATKYTTELVDLLDDEARLLNFLRMERWIADRPGHPGEVMRQWLKDLYQGNKLVKGELQLGGRTVDLGRITMPVLNIYADGDVVIPTACSRGLERRFGSRDYNEIEVPGGHIGTFVGGKAQKILAPSIASWLKERN